MITNFKRYILEAFFDATKISGQVVEIYTNPTLKEMYEIKKMSIEFKFVIDFVHEQVFLWDGMAAHKDVIPFIKKQGELKNFDIYAFYDKSEVVQKDFFDKFLTAYCDSKTLHVYLDTLADIIEIYRPKIQKDPELAKIFKQKFQTLLDYDYSWLNKYGFKGEEIKEGISRELNEAGIEL